MHSSDEPKPHSAAILNAGDLLNETEAAEFLGLKRSTMSNWRWKGAGPAWVKIGVKLVRYRRVDLLAFIDAGGEHAA